MKKEISHIAELNYNTLLTDFKVESIAANLLKYHNDFPQIFVKRIGINDRPYLKDVKNIYHTFYGLDEETVVIETFRESIYDYLPEGVFHPPSLGSYNKSIDNVIQEIKKQKEIENNARNFFQPFELEIFNTETVALLKEKEFDVDDESGALLQTLGELWSLLNKVDSETANIFLYILPFLHETRGNKEWIERFLTSFLKVDVSISFVQNVIHAQEDVKGITSLGKAKLGITLIPNKTHKDGERNWQINIGPIPYDDISKYVKGHPFRELLLNIYDYLMPISVKIFEKFITEKKETSFLLEEEGEFNRLGYSTFI
ncbi:MAG: hypothetical protein ACK5MD_10905 [Flavobacteriales bacterium]